MGAGGRGGETLEASLKIKRRNLYQKPLQLPKVLRYPSLLSVWVWSSGKGTGREAGDPSLALSPALLELIGQSCRCKLSLLGKMGGSGTSFLRVFSEVLELPLTHPEVLFGQVCLLLPVLFFRSQRALALSRELPAMYLCLWAEPPTSSQHLPQRPPSPSQQE